MTAAQATILDTIGNTSLLPLRHVVPANGARILLKLESENPTGSMKDRMALAMIEAPEADGRLQPGGAVVEYTGGSTGVSLALVCAVKRHPLDIVTSDAFAKEKLDHMRLLGAKLTIVPSENGRMTEKLTKDMIAEAGRIAKKTGAYLTDQMRNTDQISAYTKLAAEVWEQTVPDRRLRSERRDRCLAARHGRGPARTQPEHPHGRDRAVGVRGSLRRAIGRPQDRRRGGRVCRAAIARRYR
jgi:cysteine synthase A